MSSELPSAEVPGRGLRAEIDAVGDLVGFTFGDATGRIHRTHAAVSGRVFGALSRFTGVADASQPIKLAHDTIAGVAYGSTRLIGGGLLRGAGKAAALAASSHPDAPPSIERWPAGRIVRGALSGAFGDSLAGQGNPLTVNMGLRVSGRDVAVERGALREAYPDARGRVAVFLHGLCETEDAWWLYTGRCRTYGQRLRDELGYTPVYVRYNSGLHISDNGRRLSALLTQLSDNWPVPLHEIVLIGHSMGGLVARSAGYYGSELEWVSRVRSVVSLGVPHRGAPLEQGAHAFAWLLGRLPETQAWGEAINGRSVGIKDLGHGWLTDECWDGVDPVTFLRRAGEMIPFLPGASHYFISASLMRTHDHPVGRHIGDLLVLHGSAWDSPSSRQALRFPVDNYRHYGGASHFDLLGHPAIGDQIVKWLGGDRRLLPAAA